jgi:DMSO reductase anchor subunit
MCHGRLAAGEAPACVQACPNRAIRITVVNRQSVVEESEANLFLPGAPEPRLTLPTTVYRSAKPLPRNLLPADYYSARAGHAHLALVVMLVLTQMSVGAFVVEQALAWFGRSGVPAGIHEHVVHSVAALVFGFLGLGAAVFHLGRPLYGYRAVLGWRTSWLSREIIGFGLFAGLATLYAIAAAWHPTEHWQSRLPSALGVAAALAGVVAVGCSVMIYVATRRPLWSAGGTTLRFAGTAACLGLPLALVIAVVSAALDDQRTIGDAMRQTGVRLCQALIVVVLAKLAWEAALWIHLRQPQHTPLKRSAQLMLGELGLTTMKRFFFGLVGGVALPGLLLAENDLTGGSGFHPAFVAIVALLGTGLLAVGELLERYLFFKAVVAPKMPGAPAA